MTHVSHCKNWISYSHAGIFKNRFGILENRSIVPCLTTINLRENSEKIQVLESTFLLLLDTIWKRVNTIYIIAVFGDKELV